MAKTEIFPLELLAVVRLRFTFISSQSKSKSPSRSPRVKTRDCKMAPKKNKLKPNGRSSGSMLGTLNPHFQKGLLVCPKSRRVGRVEDLVANKLKPFFVQ